jgi:hypothetical protein
VTRAREQAHTVHHHDRRGLHDHHGRVHQEMRCERENRHREESENQRLRHDRNREPHLGLVSRPNPENISGYSTNLRIPEYRLQSLHRSCCWLETGGSVESRQMFVNR